MKKNLIKYCLFGLVVPCYAFSQSHSHAKDGEHHSKRQHAAHVHGVVSFNLSQEDKTLLLQIEAPGHDVIGIEHDPQNQEELKKIKQATLKLTNSSSVISLPKKADCTVSNTKVLHNYKLKVGDKHDHKDAHDHDKGHDHHKDAHDHDKGHGHEHDKHKEFEISYTMTCKKIAEVKNIQVNWFKNFSTTETIQLNMITPKKQSSSKLTAKSAMIKL